MADMGDEDEDDDGASVDSDEGRAYAAPATMSDDFDTKKSYRATSGMVSSGGRGGAASACSMDDPDADNSRPQFTVDEEVEGALRRHSLYEEPEPGADGKSGRQVIRDNWIPLVIRLACLGSDMCDFEEDQAQIALDVAAGGREPSNLIKSGFRASGLYPFDPAKVLVKSGYQQALSSPSTSGRAHADGGAAKASDTPLSPTSRRVTRLHKTLRRTLSA